MSRLAHVQTVLTDLAKKFGLESVELNRDASIALQIGEAPVALEYSAEPAEVLWIQVGLGPIPEEGLEPVELLLQAGCLAWMSSGITVALDDSAKTALAYTTIAAATLTSEGLHDTLSRLLEFALPLRAQLTAGNFQIDLPESRQSLSEAPSMSTEMPFGVLRP